MPHHIYELVDPRTNKVRYVGITNNLNTRYLRHLACSDGVQCKGDWIKGLLLEGLKPIMNTQETIEDRNSALERERYWITLYLSQGEDLLNTQHGAISPVKSSPPPKAAIEDILKFYSNPKIENKVKCSLRALVHAEIERKSAYGIRELFENPTLTLPQIAETLNIPVSSLAKLKNGEPTGASRIALLLLFFSWIYQRELSLNNVTGISVKETDKLVRQRLYAPLRF